MIRFFPKLRKSARPRQRGGSDKKNARATLTGRWRFLAGLAVLTGFLALPFCSPVQAALSMETGDDSMYMDQGVVAPPDPQDMTTPRRPAPPPGAQDEPPYGIMPEVSLPWEPPDRRESPYYPSLYGNGPSGSRHSQGRHQGGATISPGVRPPQWDNQGRPGYDGPRPSSPGNRPPQWGNQGRPGYDGPRPSSPGNRPPQWGNQGRPGYDGPRPSSPGNRPPQWGNQGRPGYDGPRPSSPGNRPPQWGNQGRPGGASGYFPGGRP